MKRARISTGSAIAIGLLLFPFGRAHAAITVTGYAFGAEGPALVGMDIEDFEDVNLIPGLTVHFGGGITTPRTYTGTLNRVFTPATAAAGTLGGPFPANTWDGVGALTNGGHGPGITGLSPGTGNYWDFSFAETTVFLFDKPQASVGIGLSNFQSLGGPSAITNHQLIVNGVLWGLVESLAGWVGGVNVRNRYVVITGTGTDKISSIAFRNVTQPDGLVFDKLSVPSASTPARPRTWGTVKSSYR